ncbi:GUN4 domain-containing protein [Nostoc punctiforme]|uniref:GUN4 domain-containing protein n=1 Tax=Nostoc punctiforme TaxID=272131 RepID=UPI0005A14AA4
MGNGHFGFSVQKRIWESVGKDYEKFGDRVGWQKGIFFNKDWLYYSDLTFRINSPRGHLPCAPVDAVWMVSKLSISAGSRSIGLGLAFFSRIETCKR